MQGATLQKIFADRIGNVTMANGVLRIRMVALNGDNSFDPAGEIAIPVKQLPAFIKDLNQTADNILDKHRKASSEKSQVSAKPQASATQQASAKQIERSTRKSVRTRAA